MMGLSSLGPITPLGASTTVPWPTFFRAPSWTWDPSIVKPVPYLTAVKHQGRRSRCIDSRIATSYLGDVGWALGFIGCAEYPERSVNHGRTWAVGGSFFTIPAGDLSPFVDVIKPLSPSVVVAYCLGTENFDLTSNAGHDWFRAWMPGNVTSVTGSVASVPTTHGAPAMTIVVHVWASRPPLSHANYVSKDLGRTWSLVIDAAP